MAAAVGGGLPASAVLAGVVAHGRHRQQQSGPQTESGFSSDAAARAPDHALSALAAQHAWPAVRRLRRVVVLVGGHDLEAFWLSTWDYFAIQSPTPFARVLSSERMPGAALV